jgi:hypothetical protein
MEILAPDQSPIKRLLYQRQMPKKKTQNNHRKEMIIQIE